MGLSKLDLLQELGVTEHQHRIRLMRPQVRNQIEEDVADRLMLMGICSTDVQPIGVWLRVCDR
jgi:hypothetical protein